jgi:arylformamidase
LKAIDLTHPIFNGMPVYPGTPAPSINVATSIEVEGYRETLLSFSSHTGTHIDAPAHFLREGKKLDEFEIGHFMGKALKVDIPANSDGITVKNLGKVKEELEGADFLLLNTGWSRFWDEDAYYQGYPVLTDDCARYLSECGLKGVGVDAISFDDPNSVDFPIHKILLGRELILIENLTNLSKLSEGLFNFAAPPLKTIKADGSPTRALAWEG